MTSGSGDESQEKMQEEQLMAKGGLGEAVADEPLSLLSCSTTRRSTENLPSSSLFFLLTYPLFKVTQISLTVFENDCLKKPSLFYFLYFKSS